MKTHRTDTAPALGPDEPSLGDDARSAEVRTPREARRLLETIEAWMRFYGYPRKDLFAFRLALDEAVANAFWHGFGGGPRPVTIAYAVRADEAVAQISDGGPGFNPAAVPHPLASGQLERGKGLGLFLMRVYSTWVRFNREGNRVTLCRQRSER